MHVLFLFPRVLNEQESQETPFLSIYFYEIIWFTLDAATFGKYVDKTVQTFKAYIYNIDIGVAVKHKKNYKLVQIWKIVDNYTIEKFKESLPVSRRNILGRQHQA